MLHKILTSTLQGAFSLAGFDETSNHVGEAHITRNYGWSVVKNKQEIGALSPPTHMWAWKQSPSWYLDCSLVKQNTQVSHAQTLDPQKLHNNKYVML